MAMRTLHGTTFSATELSPLHVLQLGQFIASSPSLFPDAYVLEFQKCLDKTDPVPYTQIQKIIEQVTDARREANIFIECYSDATTLFLYFASVGSGKALV
jgi:hypothetical protein